MLKGNEGPELKCAGCGLTIWPRCGGYWFLLLKRRGRVRFPSAPTQREDVAVPTEVEVVLCSGCGRRIREMIEEQGIACGEAYERTGTSDSKGGLRRDRCADGGASRDDNLVGWFE